MILSGRYGEVNYDPTGGSTLTPIASINAWKMSQKTDRIKVTCFQDTNHVYVPGMKDVSGDFSGYWNSDELTLFLAVDAPTPGMLELVPNTNEPGFSWKGLAYLDANIEVVVDDAPKISGTFSAAGSWTFGHTP